MLSPVSHPASLPPAIPGQPHSSGATGETRSLDERRLRADRLDLETLARNTHLSEPEKVRELCRQFEAILVRQVLRDANKARLHAGFNEDSTVNSIYQEMFHEQLGEAISRSGGLGFGRSLEAQLLSADTAGYPPSTAHPAPLMSASPTSPTPRPPKETGK